jgi:hypothetical protein
MTPTHLRPHELDGLRRAGLTPIMLDGARGCPGRCEDDERPETLLDECRTCARYGLGDEAQFIEPRASLQPDGGWECGERRAGGHDRTVPKTKAAVHPAEFGGSAGTSIETARAYTGGAS